MTKRQQAQPIKADSEENAREEMSQEAQAADAMGTHSNLDTGTGTAVVVPGTGGAVAAAPFQFKVKKLVAVPLFKLMPDAPIYVKFNEPMFVGKKLDDKKQAAILIGVTDLQTGQIGQIIVGAVLKGLMDDQYPDNSYVGRNFGLILRKRADKKYNTYDVAEIEVVDTEEGPKAAKVV